MLRPSSFCWCSLGQLMKRSSKRTVTAKDKEKAANLYGLIFYKFGGPGNYDIYQDRDQFNKIIKQIEQWEPSFDGYYSPGWKFKKIDKTAYVDAVNKNKNIRFKQMNEYQIRYSDKGYMEVQQEIDEMDRQHSSTYHVGTEAYKKIGELHKKQAEIVENLMSDYDKK